MVDAFNIQAQWPARKPNARDGIDTTFCNFKIQVNGENVTTYQTEGGLEEDHLEIPAYYMAEWIAENWWSILWEPEKNEDTHEDPGFRARHWLPAAEHGFALPSLNIVPTGDNIHLFASRREAQYADAKFKRAVDALVDRQKVETELKSFVDKVAARIAGGSETPLKAAWSLVTETDHEAVTFCRLMGALGLSPYETHKSIERALDSASSILKDRQLMDLCLTSTPENIVRSAYVAGLMNKVLAGESEINLSALPTGVLPADQLPGPAWSVGYKAAKTLREHLSVTERDVDGSSVVFDKLKVDPSSKQPIDLKGIDSPVLGGIEKHKLCGRMVLGSEGKQSRRFAAARATYFFLTGGEKDYRLITSAVTRDQQASRAFAAELLVPQIYVRDQAVGMKLKWDNVNEIAERANVAIEVIKLQARNCGLQIV